MYAQHNFENSVSASVNIRSANSEMDIQKIKKMFYSQEKDYNNAGDSGFAEQDIKTLESLAQRGYLFVLEVDNTDAGFALLKENKKVIDVVYVARSTTLIFTSIFFTKRLSSRSFSVATINIFYFISITYRLLIACV